ncbi:MAG: hypothetical protein ACTHMC_16365, partial [Pseudobacter sp.]|uniref:hypothetical protein n=1 Tax=Pseudobacter sp. TaxID=2045420 RepID=UPI003F80B653
IMVAGISQANRYHGTIELFVQLFLAPPVVIDTTGDHLYIGKAPCQKTSCIEWFTAEQQPERNRS